MTEDSCCSPVPPGKERLLKIAIWLVIGTITYNVIEGVIAVYFGLEAESIALIGFGFDSLIEMSAASLMLWRLLFQLRNQDDEAIEKTEHTVHRFVGITFFILAAYITFEAVSSLWKQQAPAESMIGILLVVLSLIIMPLLAWGKLRVAKELKSAALRSEAKETIACSILSLILLIGLGANALWGWWWADPVAGLCMIPWLIKEGIEGLKGEGCCE